MLRKLGFWVLPFGFLIISLILLFENVSSGILMLIATVLIFTFCILEYRDQRKRNK